MDTVVNTQIKANLDFNKKLLDIDDLVPDEGLEKDAEEPDESVLHVLVPDGLARGDAVRDVQMNKL